MNADGDNQIRLTNNPADDGVPTWSPDGLQIAFISDRGGSFEIYVMNNDGSNQRRITNNSQVSNVAWSPDGQQFAFESRRGENTDIYVINADGSNERRLTDHPSVDLAPAWSPDGQQIAFESSRLVQSSGKKSAIFVMNADGSNKREVISDDQYHYEKPTWSPDGQQIAFFCPGKQASLGICIVNIDGSGLKHLTDLGGLHALTISWSSPSQ